MYICININSRGREGGKDFYVLYIRDSPQSTITKMNKDTRIIKSPQENKK